MNVARFSAVGVGAILPILLLLVPPFTLSEGKCCLFFGRWCWRYATHFTPVGAAFYTTSRVNAACFLAVGVGVMLPCYCRRCRLLHSCEGKCCPFFGRWGRPHPVHFTAVGTTFYTKARVNATCFSAVGVGVILPILLLLVPPFTQRRG